MVPIRACIRFVVHANASFFICEDLFYALRYLCLSFLLWRPGLVHSISDVFTFALQDLGLLDVLWINALLRGHQHGSDRFWGIGGQCEALPTSSYCRRCQCLPTSAGLLSIPSNRRFCGRSDDGWYGRHLKIHIFGQFPVSTLKRGSIAFQSFHIVLRHDFGGKWSWFVGHLNFLPRYGGCGLVCGPLVCFAILLLLCFCTGNTWALWLRIFLS